MSEQDCFEKAPVLSYDRQPARNPRRLNILTAALAAALALAWCGRGLLMPYWDQAAHLRSQHRISHQSLPPGTVIYTEDPARIGVLQSRPDYRAKREHGGPNYPASPPDAWERRYQTASFSARDYGPGGFTANFQVNDTFGCLRTSRGGIEWIVRLDQVTAFRAVRDRRKVGLTQAAFRPVGWSPGTRGAATSSNSDAVLLTPADIFTLLAPQIDPNDIARINVSYELNGQQGMLSGVVTDNGHVQFTVRTGPAHIVKWDWAEEQDP